MATGLVLDSYFKRHEPHPGHPERPERIDAISEHFKQRGLIERCVVVPLSDVDQRWLLANHTAEYLKRLERACSGGLPYIDSPDSSICPESCAVARQAAGSVLNAVDMVMSGAVQNAFCAVRPPGHHAEAGSSMGFCLYNNIAVAARYLRDKHQCGRVLILDWDVHHGNGTQHSFYSDPQVFFCSLHQSPQTLYPGTGFADERGNGEGEGTTLNLPMRPGSGPDEYRKAILEQFLPQAEAFNPEFILISAGFDAHRQDSISNINLEDETYYWMTQQVIELAEKCCAGRIVSMLEGGYHLEALGRSAAEHVRGMLES